MNLFIKWADRKSSLILKLLLLIPAGALFVFLFPYTLLVWLPRLDARLQLPSFSMGVINYVIGGILVLLGMTYALWSISQQLFKADGTPVPVIPTKMLLVTPPFSHCRNPMSFGTFSAYLGFAIIAGSLSSIALVVVFALLLILYIKQIEEKELELRFGRSYLEYRAKTPFMIPRIFTGR